MGKLKYTLLAILLLLTLVASQGCILFSPSGEPPEEPSEPSQTPAIHYGGGEPLVDLMPADFSKVVDAVAPAVVRIVTRTITYNWFMQPIPREGVGTGVIYDSKGYILTNRHVVEGAQKITVYLADRKEGIEVEKPWWEATNTDLAVLKIEGSSFPEVSFCPKEEITVGQWVIAIGYPYNIGGAPTVSEGIISALERAIQTEDGTVLRDIIQTTAAINPGNSGGPLVDLKGRVMGINTAMLGGAENIGFAISVGTIDEFLSSPGFS